MMRGALHDGVGLNLVVQINSAAQEPKLDRINPMP